MVEFLLACILLILALPFLPVLAALGAGVARFALGAVLVAALLYQLF